MTCFKVGPLGVSLTLLGQQLVAIGYGLYRGDSRITASDAMWIPSDRLIVRELKINVCRERKLDSDQTLVFGGETDLLDYLKDHRAGEQKVRFTRVVVQL